MPRLVLMHTREIDVPPIEPNQPLQQLSPERIEAAIEEAVRKQYAPDDVQILSPPVLSQNRVWRGKCRVGKTEYLYTLMEGLYD